MLRWLFWHIAFLALCIMLLPFVLFHRYFSAANVAAAAHRPRLFFGATSIMTLPALAKSLRAEGFEAYSGAVSDVNFPVAEGFDRVVKCSASHNVVIRRVFGTLEAIGSFVWALRRADIFHLYMDGGFLRRTPLQLVELRLLKLARKRVILFPYGSDSWALERIPDPTLRAALLADYPGLKAVSKAVSERLDQFCSEADIVVGCLSHIMVLPRHDALMMTCYGVDTENILPVYPDPRDKVVRIFHAPNHRHCKGTAFLEEAVEELKDEGLNLELDLVQRLPRQEVLLRMSRAHVLVDQLLTGYGMTALEGMALGKIVITGRNWPTADLPFKDFPPFQECPLMWANQVTIKQTLRDIVGRRDQWQHWCEENRRFAEKYHSPSAMAAHWSALYPRLGFGLRRADSASE